MKLILATSGSVQRGAARSRAWSGGGAPARRPALLASAKMPLMDRRKSQSKLASDIDEAEAETLLLHARSQSSYLSILDERDVTRLAKHLSVVIRPARGWEKCT